MKTWWVKEARYKRIISVLCHLTEIQEQSKPIHGDWNIKKKVTVGKGID